MIAQFAPNPIRLNWAKGLFCAWAALAVLWVLASGWHAYTTTYLRLPFQPHVDCWEPLAKWPDGKPFDEWDRYGAVELDIDRKSTRLNSSHSQISYAVFCLKKKNIRQQHYSLPNDALDLALLKESAHARRFVGALAAPMASA